MHCCHLQLRALLKLLSHPDPSVVDRAAECIGNFALDTTYRQRIKDMVPPGTQGPMIAFHR